MENTTEGNFSNGLWKPFPVDATDSPDRASSIRELVGIVFMVFLNLLALLANTAVIVVIIKTPQLRKFVFVCHLCVVDLISAMLLMPYGIVSSSSWFGTVDFSFSECQGYIFLKICFISASILTISVISIERYYYIVHPMRYEVKMTIGLAVAVVVFIWITSILVAFVPLVGWPKGSQQGTDRNTPHCSLYWSPGEYKRVFVIIFSIFCFFLPACIIFAVYCSIFKVARIAALQHRPVPSWTASPRRRSDSINSQTTIITTRNLPQRLSPGCFLGGGKAAFTLIIIVGQFLFCWLPYFFFHLYFSNNRTILIQAQVETVVTWLAYSSFSMNPFFYGLLNRQIREELYKLGKCCWSRPRDGEFGLSSQEVYNQENILQFLQRTSCTLETRSSYIHSSPRNTLDQTLPGFRIPGQIPEETT
ncbi:probable G-protein coupled receptor [Latimeria chalumnae]|uniref:probable G-protein coupled receptor n=1 Tax=Latimeria chalumnae TaxID=7897 RepID=UPI0003C16F20